MPNSPNRYINEDSDDVFDEDVWDELTSDEDFTKGQHYDSESDSFRYSSF